ncbi:hypothetical protein FVE85_4555 [Porphyridium purpureum]|uniref:Polysaccharide pyruvyl transferase domain-containing protein n=1 Tax=Porphyridium purpureum TaxID=35688 RepID=A0A5J4YIS2_PORPP|nr:hypothetical protein FVE85_4555 [Porphyridium purpureum]|eukprot:POR0990..scf297_16
MDPPTPKIHAPPPRVVHIRVVLAIVMGLLSSLCVVAFLLLGDDVVARWRVESAARASPALAGHPCASRMKKHDQTRYAGTASQLRNARAELKRMIDEKRKAASNGDPAQLCAGNVDAQLPVYVWHPPGNDFWNGKANFGDAANVDIYRALTGLQPVVKSIRANPEAETFLYLIGTTFYNVGPKDVVSGNGWTWRADNQSYLGPYFAREPTRQLQTTAVRGRLTQYMMKAVHGPSSPQPNVFGDPALFLSLIDEAWFDIKPEGGNGVCVVAHAEDACLIKYADRSPSVTRIPVSLSPVEVARKIAGCDVVVSSSLHGLVFADALGVPSIWFRGSDDAGCEVTEDSPCCSAAQPLGKYIDYISGLEPPVFDEGVWQVSRPADPSQAVLIQELAAQVYKEHDFSKTLSYCWNLGSLRPRVTFGARVQMAKRFIEAFPMHLVCSRTDKR